MSAKILPKRLDEHRSINPYSEAAFKTLKYAPVFPDRFGSLADARAFCERFFGLLQRRAPAQRHWPAHAFVGAPRHRRSSPCEAGEHLARGLCRQPGPLPAPLSATASAAYRRLDQPTQQGGSYPEQLARSCLSWLDIFRPCWSGLLPLPPRRSRTSPAQCPLRKGRPRGTRRGCHGQRREHNDSPPALP